MGDLLRQASYILILGVVACAGLVAFLMDKVFGIGFHPIVSALIGAAVGIVLLLIFPTQGVIATIIQEKFL